MTRLHFVVHGMVQGVGFRWFVRETAEKLGLSGWVRNHWNGTVEAEAEGAPEAVAALGERLKAGPGRVELVETAPIAPKGSKREAGFEIL